MALTLRTTALKVKEVLGKDYDGCRSLDVFIRSAAAMMARINTCATDKGVTISTDEWELMETWLAAYYYTKSDRLLTSKSNGGASGSFADTEKAYLAGALDIDPSGCLNALINNQSAGGFWLGKPVIDQVSYWDRN